MWSGGVAAHILLGALWKNAESCFWPRLASRSVSESCAEAANKTPKLRSREAPAGRLTGFKTSAEAEGAPGMAAGGVPGRGAPPGAGGGKPNNSAQSGHLDAVLRQTILDNIALVDSLKGSLDLDPRVGKMGAGTPLPAGRSSLVADLGRGLST